MERPQAMRPLKKMDAVTSGLLIKLRAGRQIRSDIWSKTKVRWFCGNVATDIYTIRFYIVHNTRESACLPHNNPTLSSSIIVVAGSDFVTVIDVYTAHSSSTPQLDI